MRFNKQKIFGLYILIIVFTFFTRSPKISAEDSFFPKKGFYIGLNLPYNSIEGDFDGDGDVLVGLGEAIFIPDIESNWGSGVLMGIKFNQTALEVSYLKSTHDASFLDVKTRAVYQMVNIDYKIFSTGKRWQPYFLVGFCIPWLKVKDFRYTPYGESEITDAGFSDGFGFNIGLGHACYFTPRVSLNTETVYRMIKYGKAGSTESGVVNKKI